MDSQPFDNPHERFTIIQNNILDRIMPMLSPEGWKVLCVALRHAQSHPGSDPPDGHLGDAQIRQRTGIQDGAALGRAIQECVDSGYLLCHSSGGHALGYTLNVAYVFKEDVAPPTIAPENAAAYQALMDFARETGAQIDASQVQAAISRNELEAVVAWIETGRDMTDRDGPARFETVVQRLLQRIPPLPRELLAPKPDNQPAQAVPAPAKAPRMTAEGLWQATLTALEARVRKSKMQWFKPTKGEALRGRTLVVSVPTQRTKEWLEEGQLSDLVKETLSEVAGSPIVLVFEVNE